MLDHSETCRYLDILQSTARPGQPRPGQKPDQTRLAAYQHYSEVRPLMMN